MGSSGWGCVRFVLAHLKNLTQNAFPWPLFPSLRSLCSLCSALSRSAASRYYILDVMCWKGYALYDCTAEFRLFWLRGKLEEEPNVRRGRREGEGEEMRGRREEREKRGEEENKEVEDREEDEKRG